MKSGAKLGETGWLPRKLVMKFLAHFHTWHTVPSLPFETTNDWTLWHNCNTKLLTITVRWLLSMNFDSDEFGFKWIWLDQTWSTGEFAESANESAMGKRNEKTRKREKPTSSLNEQMGALLLERESLIANRQKVSRGRERERERRIKVQQRTQKAELALRN